MCALYTAKYVTSSSIDQQFLPWLVWLSGLSVTYEPKGRVFNSQTEHVPGLQARPSVGGMQEATTHGCFSPSL